MDMFQGTYDRALAKGARAAVRDVLAVKKNERVLIITNPGKDTQSISMALYDAVLEDKGAPILMFQREKGQFDFAEEEVVKALATNPEIGLSISKDRLGKDRHGLKHGYMGKRRYDHIYDLLYNEKKLRGFWSPGITTEMFSRTVPIDYTRLRSDSSRICKVIGRSDTVRVVAPGGTDLTIGVSGRKAHADDGDFRKPGQAGNIPSGEVYVSPVVGTTNGVIAFDGSMVVNDGEVIIKKPIMATVRGGYVTELSGGKEAEALRESIREGEKKARENGRKGLLKPSMVEKYAKNASSIGELGIGLNRKARIVANMLEDEKVYGTCHFAVGSNYDGDAEALIHLDGLVDSPTITAVSTTGRETTFMERGKLVWD
ncbi:MAG: aminopeptidase [Thermoplasmata archaeon]|nr:aminopeptidase [Thermoplasmata archaeon]